MPTRRKKKKLQNGQFSYVMWQMDMGEEHKRERETWSKTGHKSPKFKAKGHPKKKKKKEKKEKKGKKKEKKVYIQRHMLFGKNCVST
jgi:hypothetical protein